MVASRGFLRSRISQWSAARWYRSVKQAAEQGWGAHLVWAGQLPAPQEVKLRRRLLVLPGSVLGSYPAPRRLELSFCRTISFYRSWCGSQPSSFCSSELPKGSLILLLASDGAFRRLHPSHSILISPSRREIFLAWELAIRLHCRRPSTTSMGFSWVRASDSFFSSSLPKASV